MEKHLSITNLPSYTNWTQKKASRGRLRPVLWTSDEVAELPWEETFMIDEIPENDNWNTFATRNKLEIENMYRGWGVPKEGTKHYMSIRPELTADMERQLLGPYSNTAHSYNFLRLTPGHQIMWHYDTYGSFVKFNNLDQKDIDNVCRTVVMMLPWDRGQIFQLGNAIYSHWKAGDTFTWKGDVWHGMSNFGPSEAVMAQVTFLDEEGKYDNI